MNCDGDNPRFDVPLKRVKKRRVIQQPLSDLAVEIIREALEDGQGARFRQPARRHADEPQDHGDRAARHARTRAKVKTPGICALLGLKPFTPHDLRRTAATLAGDLGFDDAWIAKCLDHAASKKQEQIVPTVTGKVYNHSKRMKEKRAVLDGVAADFAADHLPACLRGRWSEGLTDYGLINVNPAEVRDLMRALGDRLDFAAPPGEQRVRL